MPLNKDVHPNLYSVRGYDKGVVKIDDQQYHGSILVSEQGVIDPWPAQASQTLDQDTLIAATKQKPDVLLIGREDGNDWLSPDIHAWLLNQGIGVELMPIGSACRTYNLMRSDGRPVVLGIII